MVPSLLSIMCNAIHPWPRKEIKLSTTVQANFITQHSGTSKILKSYRTVGCAEKYNKYINDTHKV